MTNNIVTHKYWLQLRLLLLLLKTLLFKMAKWLQITHTHTHKHTTHLGSGALHTTAVQIEVECDSGWLLTQNELEIIKRSMNGFSSCNCHPNYKELYLLKFTCNKNSPSWKFRPSPNCVLQLSWIPFLSVGEDFSATLEKPEKQWYSKKF